MSAVMLANGPPESESPGSLAGESEANCLNTSKEKNSTTSHAVRCFLGLLNAATDPGLARGDVACLAVILDRFNCASGTAWPGINRIADEACLHRSNVIRAISRLEANGYLTVQRGGIGRSNRYVPTFKTSRADATSSESATSGNVASKVVAPARLQLVAQTRPELTHRTYPKNIPNKSSREKPLAERFQEFWNVFPRKQGDKAKAEKIWAKKNLDAIAEPIFAHLIERVASDPQWRDRKFIPLPTTFLNGDRWNDEWTPEIRKPSASDRFAEKTYTGTPDDELPSWAH